jgi:hypothetical protein
MEVLRIHSFLTYIQSGVKLKSFFQYLFLYFNQKQYMLNSIKLMKYPLQHTFNGIYSQKKTLNLMNKTGQYCCL